jgi:hypothetical protein
MKLFISNNNIFIIYMITDDMVSRYHFRCYYYRSYKIHSYSGLCSYQNFSIIREKPGRYGSFATMITNG